MRSLIEYLFSAKVVMFHSASSSYCINVLNKFVFFTARCALQSTVTVVATQSLILYVLFQICDCGLNLESLFASKLL